MNGDLLFLAVDVGRVLCPLLIAAAVLLAGPGRANAQLVALICLCTCCYVVLGRYDYGFWIAPAYRIDVGAWQPLLNLARNLTPGLLMILLRRLFTDRGDVPRPLLAAFAVQVFLEGPAQWLGLPLPPVVTQTAASLLQTLFVLLALYWTVADWRVDLVEARRRARVVVTAVVAMQVVAASLLLRVVIGPGSRANYDAQRVIAVLDLLVAAALLVWLTRNGLDDVLSPARRPRAAAVASEREGADLRRLNALMEEERLYREPGLTLKLLADRVGVPEYRLRRLIHEALGFRNFNAFLHAHRVKEACERLEDPMQRRTPILTIALTVGYQSLNTFNRGFRDTMGVTPSAYRRAREET